MSSKDMLSEINSGYIEFVLFVRLGQVMYS